MADTFFISTTIPYVNGKPHLGHVLEFCQTDTFARHRRLTGRDVWFLTGSDENSLKNVRAAEAEGIGVVDLVDRNVRLFLDLKDPYSLSYDQFIRTSVDDLHLRGAAEFWTRVADKGDVYRKSYAGLYCVGCELFYDADELVDGKCPEHGVPPEHVEEENWFFRLSRYQQQLDDLISSDELRVHPETRKNEVLSFVRAGLEDISISRSQERARGWGIPVPGDPDQVMYVWFDALTNYITALGYADDAAPYRRYWSGGDTRLHVLGKGVIRFHAVYWPAMLLSAGAPLPTDVFVHGYITAAGAKLSKSAGNTDDVAVLTERYGAEALRLFLLRDVTPFGDHDFTEERLVERYNADLANGLGNLFSRVTKLIATNCGGRVPGAPAAGNAEAALRDEVAAAVRDADAALQGFDHREALIAIWRAIGAANAYINEQEPWHLAKAEGPVARARLETVLATSAEALRQAGLALRPLLPDAAARVLAGLGADPAAAGGWSDALTGAAVDVGPGLFPRLNPPA